MNNQIPYLGFNPNLNENLLYNNQNYNDLAYEKLNNKIIKLERRVKMIENKLNMINNPTFLKNNQDNDDNMYML